MTNLDSIVRETILERNLTPHAYVRLLSFGLTCLKELNLDITGSVKSATLTVDEFSRIKLPCDYVDWVRVGWGSGQYVLNMSETSTFNRKLKQVNGVYVPRSTASDDNETLAWYYTQDYWSPWYGGFRTNNPISTATFMVLDGVMQLHGGYSTGDEIDLDYIAFDPTSAKAEVHKYAEATVKAWMEYKWLCSQPRVAPYEKNAARQTYEQSLRLLLARKNPLTVDSIMRTKSRYQKTL